MQPASLRAAGLLTHGRSVTDRRSSGPAGHGRRRGSSSRSWCPDHHSTGTVGGLQRGDLAQPRQAWMMTAGPPRWRIRASRSAARPARHRPVGLRVRRLRRAPIDGAAGDAATASPPPIRRQQPSMNSLTWDRVIGPAGRYQFHMLTICPSKALAIALESRRTKLPSFIPRSSSVLHSRSIRCTRAREACLECLLGCQPGGALRERVQGPPKLQMHDGEQAVRLGLEVVVERRLADSDPVCHGRPFRVLVAHGTELLHRGLADSCSLRARAWFALGHDGQCQLPMWSGPRHLIRPADLPDRRPDLISARVGG